ncbi:MAG: ABC transporter ATP-binding protein [Bacteroidota bacterium]
MSQNKEPVFRISQMQKAIKGTHIIQNLGMQVPDNAVYGLIGKNGAGKTTLLRILSGLYTFEEGEFFHRGSPIASNKLSSILHHAIGYCPSHPVFYHNRTAYSNLEIACFQLGIHTRPIPHVLESVGLADQAQKKVGAYSTGMTRRLAIARTLLTDAQTMIFDEPSTGLDPGSKEEVYQIFRSLQLESQKTLIVSSHDLTGIESYCTHVGFMNHGTIELEQSLDALIAAQDRTQISLVIRQTDLVKLQQLPYAIQQQTDGHNGQVQLHLAVPHIPSFLKYLVALDVDIFEVKKEKKTLSDIYSEVVQ